MGASGPACRTSRQPPPPSLFVGHTTMHMLRVGPRADTVMEHSAVVSLAAFANKRSAGDMEPQPGEKITL